MPSLEPRAIGLAPRTSLSLIAYRNQAKGFDPRSGDGARRLGGRFNPPHSFPVLYLCLTLVSNVGIRRLERRYRPAAAF